MSEDVLSLPPCSPAGLSSGGRPWCVSSPQLVLILQGPGLRFAFHFSAPVVTWLRSPAALLGGEGWEGVPPGLQSL